MVKINNFILNTDFVTEKLVPDEYNISGTITGRYVNGRTLLGTYNLIVPSGNYMINSVHSSDVYAYGMSGPYGTYAEGLAIDPYFKYTVFGEILQTSVTNIQLLVYVNIGGNSDANIPTINFNVRFKLTYLPI